MKITITKEQAEEIEKLFKDRLKILMPPSIWYATDIVKRILHDTLDNIIEDRSS